MTTSVFQPPPGWPNPPDGWQPPAGWAPDPSWPAPPPGWQLWVAVEGPVEKRSDRMASGAHDDSRSVPHDAPPTIPPPNPAVRQPGSPADLDLDDLVILDDERVLQSVGIYRYHHPLENSPAFKAKLDELAGRIAAMVKSGRAIERSTTFTYDNSIAKGRRMTDDLSKLMLRAYNAEADNSIRSLRLGNVTTAKKRLEASATAIEKLGRMMEMRISSEFHALRLEEIELTADWLMKKQEEKEAAREERARLREEKRVEKELADERARLEKELAHIQNAVASLLKSGDRDPQLEHKLHELEAAIAHNEFRMANIRAGYVYVISNRGAFGQNVVKIGLTRRLEPLDRVHELGGASVPFRFDVHALYFSEDAVTLENELHAHFAHRAVNQANRRKEFFFASPAEVRTVLEAKVGNLLEFTEQADATEYLQSVANWPTGIRAGPQPNIPTL